MTRINCVPVEQLSRQHWSPTSKDLEISWARIMERLNG